MIDFVARAERLLGRHERRRTEHEPEHRELALRGAVEHAGDAEVEQLEDAVVADEDVLGLEITMDDPGSVHGAEDVHQLVGEVERLEDGDLVAPLLPVRLERVALEEIHGEEHAAVVGHAVVEDAHDAQVLDRVGEVAFTEEALADRGIGAQRGVQDLEGGPRSVAVRHGVDRRHGPGPEQRVDAPLAADDAPDAPLGLLNHSLGRGNIARLGPPTLRSFSRAILGL